MKKLSKIIILFIILIPIYIYAKSYDNYDKSINYANSYMNKFSDKNKFLFKSGPYSYENGGNSINSRLLRVGLLNKDEYLLTKNGKSSYLSSGQEYWTMTEGVSNNHFYVDYDILSKTNNAYSGTRVTQFVLPTTVVNGDGTFTSPWTFDNRYSVVFKVNSSKYGSVDPSNEMVKPNSTINDVRITENTGYSYKSNDCGLEESYKVNETTRIYKTKPITEDTVCVINFEKRKIRISYDCSEGTGTVAGSTVAYGKEYTIEDYTCSRPGYTQETWRTGGGYEWDKGTYPEFKVENGERGVYDNKLDLLAKWKANNYTVTFNCNGGSGSVDSQTATYDTPFTLTSSTCSRPGYTQDGWNEKTDGTGTSWTTSNTNNWTWNRTSNVTLYAKWKANTYTVSFDCNGGSGAPANQTATYNSNFTLTSSTCSRSNYTQNGWNEKADGTGTSWTTSNTNNWKWDRTSNVKLYAVWKKNAYTASKTWTSQGNVYYNGTSFSFNVILYYYFTQNSSGEIIGTVTVTGSVSGVSGPSNWLKGKFSVGSWSKTFDEAVSTNSQWVSLSNHNFGKINSITIKWEPDNVTKIWDPGSGTYIIENSWNASQTETVTFN